MLLRANLLIIDKFLVKPHLNNSQSSHFDLTKSIIQMMSDGVLQTSFICFIMILITQFIIQQTPQKADGSN